MFDLKCPHKRGVFTKFSPISRSRCSSRLGGWVHVCTCLSDSERLVFRAQTTARGGRRPGQDPQLHPPLVAPEASHPAWPRPLGQHVSQFLSFARWHLSLRMWVGPATGAPAAPVLSFSSCLTVSDLVPFCANCGAPPAHSAPPSHIRPSEPSTPGSFRHPVHTGWTVWNFNSVLSVYS